jgi:predicted AAA+ superfamily ATPase
MAARKKQKKVPPSLSPSQAGALKSAVRSLEFGRIIVFWGATGFGKSTMLEELHRTRFPKAPLLSTRDFLDAMRDRHPLGMEEAYVELLRAALKKSDAVLIDDLHLFNQVVCCSYMYPRKDYLPGPLTALVNEVIGAGKTLIMASNGSAPGPIDQRCYYHGVKQLDAKDYSHICAAYLPAKTHARIDFSKVHRFAPKLNAHQLRGATQELALDGELDTDRFIDYVRKRRMASNVDLSEVQSVELSSLKGLDDVIESLEANVVLPFENDALATELKIKPKRGVLLVGPPGTGKTTVGRALAHRLKSKFFLIDGTFISGTQAFYQKIQQVAEAAKLNAPSIIFIDDSDVIFEQGREQGLYRYLLTMLDGIESDTSGRVCVMMTAMNVASLPPALIRSGRIELWLETRLPDDAARTSILEELLADLPQSIAKPDVARLASSTAGLTGADLKRLVEDGKILFAFDMARSRPLAPTTEYFVAAIEKVHANKQRYAMAEAASKAAEAMRPVDPFAQYQHYEEQPENPA